MVLDRLSDYPHIDGGKPDEIVYLTLPNNGILGLRWQHHAAVVPVLHDSNGIALERVNGKLKVIGNPRIPGTAFCVFPQYGLFVTAAHVLPDDAERAMERNELAVALPTPAGPRVALALRKVAIDAKNDVALCCAGVEFKDFQYPYMPIALNEESLSDDVVLYAAGFPGTTYTAKTIDLQPTAYVGEGAERLTGSFSVIVGESKSLKLSGKFIRVQMNARPGLSGGPLCASSIDPTKPKYKKEWDRLKGGVVGVMSWREVDHPSFKILYGFFADARVALDLRLPIDGAYTLRELYERTPKRDLPEPS
jgi:hypothetical protein